MRKKRLFRHRRCLLIFGFVIPVWLAGTVPAVAYILRGPHVLELMTNSLGSAKTLMVSQRVMFYGDPLGSVPVEAGEILRYVFPDTFRCDSQSKNAKRIQLVSNGEELTVVDGKIAVADTSQFDLYKDILLYRSRKVLSRRLSDLGIDVSLTRLARFQKRIMLVLGAEMPDTAVNQIWVDKETFQPVRWLMPGENVDGGRMIWEMRYSDWRQVNGAWYPMHIQFFKNDRMVREIRVEKMTVNPEFSPELFDMARLRLTHLPEPVESDGGSVSDELDEVQETIDEFRKKFE
jgi:outer membrane lipoprotein-sorting protein